jgi:hypothetical protein
MQTACAKGAVLGSVIAYGEFGDLADSELAQALVSCNVQVVACGHADACPRGGIGAALLSAMCLRSLDQTSSSVARSTLPLLVASARPEVVRACEELRRRGFYVSLATPPPNGTNGRAHAAGAAMNPRAAPAKNTPPSAATSAAPSAAARPKTGHKLRRLERFSWPQLYPVAEGDEEPPSRGTVLSHSASHKPRPLPAWL